MSDVEGSQSQHVCCGQFMVTPDGVECAWPDCQKPGALVVEDDEGDIVGAAVSIVAQHSPDCGECIRPGGERCACAQAERRATMRGTRSPQKND